MFNNNKPYFYSTLPHIGKEDIKKKLGMINKSLMELTTDSVNVITSRSISV